MHIPQKSIETIPQELDHKDWQLELDEVDVQVFSRKNASQSSTIGFKTITEHPVPMHLVYQLLKDVCGAMHEINDMFVLGEHLKTWPIEEDQEGKLVRTSFKMPFPLADREFLHGLHSVQIDAKTFIIAYTPVENIRIPIQNQYVRCPMSISGQRITLLDHGTIRVEHLMVYSLGGNISTSLQDNWMKKTHTGAYKKEWRNLKTTLFPTLLSDVDPMQLTPLAQQALESSKNWPKTGKPKAGTVAVGRLSYCPKSVFRLDLEVNTSVQTVVDVLADQSLVYLPQWNKEFMHGEIIETLEELPNKSSWLIRVQYSTPAILSNREYIYYFSREWLSDKEALIIYNSVEHDSPVPKGFVRALLYPTIHRCIQLDNHRTKIEHLLATDLGGNLGKWQDSLLKGGLVQAQCRDMDNQVKLFEGLNNKTL